MTKKFFVRSLMIAMALVLLGAFLYAQNHWILSTEYSLKWSVDGIASATQNEGEASLNIVHLSDLHSTWFGEDQEKLIQKIRGLKPDFVVITGDLVDSKRTDKAPAIALVRGLSALAPLYISYGNHEAWAFNDLELDHFTTQLEEAGAKILRGESQVIAIPSSNEVLNLKKEVFTVAGIDDPTLQPWNSPMDMPQKVVKSLDDDQGFSLLLSHRPERFDAYVDMGVDLVLTGHAHGGQVRLPWIGGLVAPDQGFFPKYDSGIFKMEKTAMIVNRGLGNSIIPMRLFNYPEIVLVKLYL